MIPKKKIKLYSWKAPGGKPNFGDELGPEIIQKALEALRIHFDDHVVGYNLLPETFTMKELQQLYETVFDKPYRRNNFQKMVLDLGILERLEKKYSGAANKAPFLYKFKVE